jgi:hypothetical protein
MMQKIVNHIAEGLKYIDDSRVPFRNYQPGVGPYGEPQLVRKLLKYLVTKYPEQYSKAKTKRIPDMLIPTKWALEFKIVRPFGDNGKEAEHWSQNLIHPYPGNVSSISDAYKLLESSFSERKGIIIISYEHTPPKIPVDLLVDCFENIAKTILDLPLSEKYTAKIKNLVHPVHQQATVYGWELGKANK